MVRAWIVLAGATPNNPASDPSSSLRVKEVGCTGCGKSIICHPVHGEPREVRDLLFFSACKKQQIPRANPALRNDKVRVFPRHE